MARSVFFSMSDKAIDLFFNESTCLTSCNAVDYLSIERSDLWYVHIMRVYVWVLVGGIDAIEREREGGSGL